MNRFKHKCSRCGEFSQGKVCGKCLTEQLRKEIRDDQLFSLAMEMKAPVRVPREAVIVWVE